MWLNGDVFDFAQISTHPNRLDLLGPNYDPEIGLEEEIFIVQSEIFHPLRKAVGPNTRIVMRLGNHEARYFNAAEKNPGALEKMLKVMRKRNFVLLEDVAQFKKWGIELSKKPVDIIADSFTLIHGVKSSKGVAKQNLMRYGSGTSGHSHRMGSYTEVMHGKVQGWWESGCMRTIDHIEYLPFGDKPDWSNGYLELTINNRTGKFFCIPHFVVKGETCFHGQIFTA